MPRLLGLGPALAEPEDGSPAMPTSPLTPKKLFVCTYEGRLTNLCVPVGELVERLEPSGPVLAINSNFGHKAQRGYERYIKKPAAPKQSRAPAVRRARKLQCDGTCFNSAVEPVLSIDFPGISRDKVYFVKCFSTTGQTQVPGVLREDLEDGEAVLRAWVGFLNEAGVGADAEGNPKPVEILGSQPNMLNFKFRVVNVSDRMLLRLAVVADYMHTLEVCAVHADRGWGGEPPTGGSKTPLSFTGEQREASLGMLSTALRGITPDRLPALLPAVLALPPTVLAALLPRLLPPQCPLIVPPYKIKQATPRDILEVKFSCCFVVGERNVRLNIFQGGKINILGANSFEAAEGIYSFLLELFRACWPEFVRLKPLPDAVRLRQAAAHAPGGTQTPPDGRQADNSAAPFAARAAVRDQAPGEDAGLSVSAEAFEEYIAQLSLELGIDAAPTEAATGKKVAAGERPDAPAEAESHESGGEEVAVDGEAWERSFGGSSAPSPPQTAPVSLVASAPGTSSNFRCLEPDDLLALAAEFEFAEDDEDEGEDEGPGSALKNPGGECVDGKYEEDYEEDSLDDDAEGGRAPPAHRATETSDDAVRKYVAGDEDEQ
jgi:hypothetical protein